jgi:hypothetical protein
MEPHGTSGDDSKQKTNLLGCDGWYASPRHTIIGWKLPFHLERAGDLRQALLPLNVFTCFLTPPADTAAGILVANQLLSSSLAEGHQINGTLSCMSPTQNLRKRMKAPFKPPKEKPTCPHRQQALIFTYAQAENQLNPAVR